MSKIHPLVKLYGTVILIALALWVLPARLQTIAFGGLLLVSLTIFWYYALSIGIKTTKWLKYSVRNHPERLPYWFLGLAMVLIYLASVYYSLLIANLHAGFYLFVLSLILLYPARHILPAIQAHAQHDRFDAEGNLRYPAIFIAIVCLIVLTMINTPGDMMQPIQRDLGLFNSPAWVQMILLGCGIIGLIHGFRGQILPARFTWQPHHTLLLLIVLLGAIVCLWDIGNTYRLFVDEYSFIGDILYIRDTNPEIFLPRSSPNSQVYPFFQALLSSTLGAGFISLRLPSIALSLTGLFAIYALARQLFSVRVALMSALLLATLPVYLQFSRIGLNNIADAVFGVFAFAYVLRGMRSGHASDYAMAGIMLGLTHYFYEGGRLFFTPFMVCWLVWIYIFARRDPQFRPLSRKQLFALVFCLLVLILPMYHTFYQFNFPLVERLDTTGVESNVLSERVVDFLANFDPVYLGASVQRYVFTPTKDIFFQSEYAFIVPVLVPFFLLGFGRLLWSLRTLRGSLLVWWGIGAFVGNSFVEQANSAESPRYIIVYSILMLIVALGIRMLWLFVEKRINFRWHRHLQIVVIAFLLVVTVGQIGHYFGAVVPNYYAFIFNRRGGGGIYLPNLDDLVLRAIDLPDNTTVVVLSNNEFPTVHGRMLPAYLGRGRETLRIESESIVGLSDNFFEDLPRNTNYVFAFLPYYRDVVMEMIERHFVITEVTTSPDEMPEEVDMVFAHAPLSVNGGS